MVLLVLSVAVPASLVILIASISNPGGSGSSRPTPAALNDIPPNYLNLYIMAAGVCPGLDWTILAGIGKIESDHGRLRAPGVTSGQNDKGAEGPMQFLQSTFDAVAARHKLPGAGPPSPYDPEDAIYAAAYNLCDNGAATNLYNAIFAYNHADWYVREVLAQAASYGTVDGTGVGAPTAAARIAINFAMAHLGDPYVFGGTGPHQWDCSGLVQAAYAAGGIALPRTTYAQVVASGAYIYLRKAGPGQVPAENVDQWAPGDLLFKPGADGTADPANPGHVAIYLGNRQVIEAPQTGDVVHVVSLALFDLPSDGGPITAVTRPSSLSKKTGGGSTP